MFISFWAFTSTLLKFIFLTTDCQWWFECSLKWYRISLHAPYFILNPHQQFPVPLTIFLPTVCSRQSRIFLLCSSKFSQLLPQTQFQNNSTHLSDCSSSTSLSVPKSVLLISLVTNYHKLNNTRLRTIQVNYLEVRSAKQIGRTTILLETLGKNLLVFSSF